MYDGALPKQRFTDEGRPVPTERAVEGPEYDAESLRSAIRARRETILQRELGRAFGRLEAHGTLTDRQREILEEMARAIVDDVLRPSGAALAVNVEDDPEAVQTVTELLGLDDARTCSGERPSEVGDNDRM